MIYLEHRPEEKFILTIFSGVISTEDLNGHYRRLMRIDDETGNIKGLTVLCGNVKLRAVDGLLMVRLARSLRNANFLKGSRNAVVACTSLTYQMARINAINANLRRVDKTAVFKGEQLKLAIRWLKMRDKEAEILAIVQQYGTPERIPA